MKKSVVKVGILAAVAILIIIVFFVYNHSKANKVTDAEVEQGIEMIKKLEAVEVADVEEVMESIAVAESESEKAWHERPLIERFENAMVLGDSEAASLAAYGILQDSQVAAKIGCKVENSDEHVQTAIDKKPAVVFMTYGKNDLGYYGSAEEFAEVYGEKLAMLKDGIPNVRIYVVSILPSTQAVKEEMPYMGNDASFNEALKAKASEMGLEYIDCTGLVQDEYYEPDGIHYIRDLYEEWAIYMADIAEI